jgi:quercetin dioxygenase-like cupin family protein
MITTIKRFDQPDEVRRFEKGKFEIIHLGGATIGRASYEPGWKWSLHNRAYAGTELCMVEHAGLVLSGRCMVEMMDGTLIELSAGQAFYVPPGHDSWVEGDEPYVSLHFLGADQYAKSGG